jgi:amidase
VIPTRGHLPGPPGTLSELPLGTVGPIARSAADLALGLDVLAGPDAAHAVAWRLELPPPRAGELRGYRIAAWLDDEFCPVDSEVLKVLAAALDAVREDGARIDEHDRPCAFRDAERLVQLLIWSGVSLAYPEAEFARLRELAERAGDEDSSPARHARNVTATAREVGIAQEMKARTAAACAEFFTRHDVLVCPITPTAAIPHDHNPDVDARRISVNGQLRPYGDQIPWASLPGLCGLPAVVVPVGRTSAGLPVGLQVIGPRLEDHTAIDVAGRIGRLFGGFTAPPGLPS